MLKYNWERTEIEPEKWFRGHFRVGHAVFNAVAARLATMDAFKVPVSVGSRAIDVPRQLGMFLMRFGNEKKTYFEVADWFDVGNSSVRAASLRVANALYSAYPRVVHLAKSGPQKDAEMAAFEKLGWTGCRALIDCTQIPVVPDAASRARGDNDGYVNRDSVSTKVYQCIVSKDLRFLDIDGGNGGKTNDQVILDESEFAKNVGLYLGAKEWLMADMGYKLVPWCISGFRSNEISGHEFAAFRSWFNRYFSGTRITIERAFGVLKARFRSLLSGLFLRDPSEYSPVVLALMIMHNICIQYRDEVDAGEISAAIEEERKQKEARMKALKAAAAAAAAAGAAEAPVVHENTLAAGRARRAEIAARVGAKVGKS